MNSTAARELVTTATLVAATCVVLAAAAAGWPIDGAAAWALAGMMLVAALNVVLLGAVRRRNSAALHDALGVLRGAAIQDPLTRLLNRVGIVDEVRRRLLAESRPTDAVANASAPATSSSPTGSPDEGASERSDSRRATTVLTLSLDRLAAVNQMLGHDRGDTLLVEMADRIADTVGDRGAVGRLGADVFAVVLAEAFPEEVDQLTERLLRVIQRPVRLGGIDLAVAATIGTARSGDADGPEELVRCSGLALEAARASAPHRVVPYETSMSLAAEERVRLIDELRNARAAGEFEVYYQPIVALATGHIVGAEALLRWNHPTRGIVDAGLWVGLAAEIGLLSSIGHATFSECCRHFAAVNAGRSDDPLSVAVNLSAAELLAPDLVVHVRGALEASGLDPRLLVVEVDEASIANPATFEMVRRLRELGIRIAIDDFGTGYSSLDDLRRLGIDQVKIDPAFVSDLGIDPTDTAIVRAVIELAGTLGLEVVAEGVTSEAQVEQLRELGGDLGQGFLFGRALPFTRFLATVDRIDQAATPAEPSVESPAPALATHEATDAGGQLA